MSEFHHALVWINHSEATVSRFRDSTESEVDVHSHAALQRLHHLRTGWQAGGNMPDNIEFYQRIAAALDNDSEVVITGPGNAKTELKAFLDRHHPNMSSRLQEGAARRAAGGLS